MKVSPRRIHRPTDGRPAAELSGEELVIPLPDPRLLRLIARSALLAAAIVSFPWIRAAFLSAAAVSDLANDDLYYMPKLLQDMKAYGLLQSEGRSLFVGDAGLYAALLRSNGVAHLHERKIQDIADRSLDFVFLVSCDIGDAKFDFIDRTMRVGGVSAFRLGEHPVKPFNLPANYRMVYIQNIGRTIIAVKKLFYDNAGGGRKKRRLLSVQESKKEAMSELEDALLEPAVATVAAEKHRRRIRYLPELTGESLDKYPRRVFVDMGLPGRSLGAERWFRRNYPRRNKEFEIIRVDLIDDPAATDGGDVAAWLRENVKEEEYVVLKAEAEAVEEIARGRAIGLVDELFMECRSQRGEDGEVDAGRMRRRNKAYWECLALFGKLREGGVAVHQWWD